MSAMANVLLALLALVLCASQANAAQPATNQSCAETKKSLEDGGLAEITVDSFPAFNLTLRQSFCDGYWHNVGGSAQSAKAWSACSSVLKNAVSVGKARCPAPVYVDKNYKAPKGKRIIRKVFTTKHVIKSQQVHVSQCIDFNLLGNSYSAHVQRQNYQKSFVRSGVPSFASVKYSKPPPPGCTVLFQASGNSGKFANQWGGWYSAGSTVDSGSGKRAAYDHSPVSFLRLSDSSGRFVEYKLNKGYAGRTLLSIVQGCMGSNRYNTDTSAWRAGLCSNVGTRTSSSGSFTGGSVSSVLRIGVGEGQVNSYDWALLMPLSGNGQGDYHGANVWAFGGEALTNNGYSGTVAISACSGTPAKSTGYWQVTSGSNHCEIVDGGRCVTDGSGNYGSKESCRVIARRQFFVYTKQYLVEGCCDYLQIGSTKFKTRGPHGVKVAQGTPIYWSSDGSVQDKGWKICASETPMNVTHPPTRDSGATTAAPTPAPTTSTAAPTTTAAPTPAPTTTAAQGTTAKAKGSNYVVGQIGKNSCSKGTVVVDTESECRQAAAANGKKLGGTSSWSGLPKGCFVYQGYYWYFNKHSNGTAHSQSRPVCQVAATEWSKQSRSYCGTNFPGTYSSLSAGKAACLKQGKACIGVYDERCDGQGFRVCNVTGLSSSSIGSCVYTVPKKQVTHGTTAKPKGTTAKPKALGTSNKVSYKGHWYGTLSNSPVDGTQNTCHGQNTYLPVPQGCRIAPDTAESRFVVGNYNWNTHVVLLDSGKPRCTKNYASSCNGGAGGIYG